MDWTDIDWLITIRSGRLYVNYKGLSVYQTGPSFLPSSQVALASGDIPKSYNQYIFVSQKKEKKTEGKGDNNAEIIRNYSVRHFEDNYSWFWFIFPRVVLRC